jgi:hypothetical protein
MLCLFKSIAQDSNSTLELIILQDVQLALYGHDDRSDSFTTNIRFRPTINAKQRKLGHFYLAPEIEYANLNIEFWRFSNNIGYRFNTLINNLDFGLGVGHGLTLREGKGYLAFNLDGFIHLKITKKMYITFSTQLLQRPDVEDKDVVLSNSIGIRFPIY